jgi:hypothetical protein
VEALEARGSPYADRRRRAAELRERHPFAAEVLTLYLALLDVQERAYLVACARPPQPQDVPGFVAAELLPRVVEATVSAGPPKLAEAVVGRFHSGDLGDLVGRWLRGTEQSLVDRYLARAASAPVLEALAPAALLVTCSGGEPDERHCPRCGGLPQLSYFSISGEALVTGPRYLLCSRCSHSWIHPRLVCAACGESRAEHLTVYSETEEMPQLRVDGCGTCRRYLVGVDLRRDAAAVPVVDELAALPLDLYAKEHGLRKALPNLMGM